MTGLIFDLDGTLANSIPYIIQTAQAVFRQLGKEFTDEEIIQYIGVPLLQTGEELLGPGRGQEYTDAYMRRYAESGFCPEPFPGVKDMLDSLTRAGAKIALCTSKRREPAHKNLKMMQIDRYFPVIVNSESGYGAKPDPGPALGAAKELGLPPAECIFIGDSIHDIACGNRARMATVGVTWGASDEATLKSVNAAHICRDVPELTGFLLKRLS